LLLTLTPEKYEYYYECLFVFVCLRTYLRNHTTELDKNFFLLLPVAMTRSCCGGVVMRRQHNSLNYQILFKDKDQKIGIHIVSCTLGAKSAIYDCLV